VEPVVPEGSQVNLIIGKKQQVQLPREKLVVVGSGLGLKVLQEQVHYPEVLEAFVGGENSRLEFEVKYQGQQEGL
jgi:hypothetical protein